MSIMISRSPRVEVIIQGARARPLSNGNLTANGSEQTLAEFVGTGSVYGSVGLDEMVEDDTVVIRQYIQQIVGNSYHLYGSESYSGVQVLPVVYFPAKATTVAIKTTLKQTSGAYKRYRHDFLWEG